MSFKLLAGAALLAALPSAFAGKAVINNHCDFPVYITHSQSGADDGQKTFQPGQSFNQPISGSAVCLKIMTQPGFCLTDNCVQLEYTSEPNTLWYDLSNINAGALSKFIDHGMTVNVSDPNAQQIDCPPGQARCKNTYYEWFENENSYSAKPDSDLIMNLCSSGASSTGPLAGASSAVGSILGQASSALAPSSQPSAAAPSAASSAASAATSAAPVVPVVDHQDNGSHGPEVVVTVTKTMMAREEETAAPEKRHIHAHAHHHRH